MHQIDFPLICNYIYQVHHLPSFYYRQRQLVSASPDAGIVFALPAKYLDSLRLQNLNFTYCETALHSLYGYLRLPESEEELIIGPMNMIRFSENDLYLLHREYEIPPKEAKQQDAFFLSLPYLNTERFFQILSYINYTITRNTQYLHQYSPKDNASHSYAISQGYYDASYIFDEKQYYEENYLVEKQITRFIEEGNVNELDFYLRNLTHIPIHEKIADNNLRQMKNVFIILVTIASHAAIRGGISPSYAAKLSDTYIYKIEQISNTKEISSYLYHALIDFTQNVAQKASPLKNSSTDMMRIIEYIQHNLNQPLSVSGIASEFGFSRSHLSRKFKQELGFDLSAFITRCKLETSKGLLTHSDKSLHEISVYLCYSSQAHFQKAFKNQFGLTPMQYRNQTKK